MTRLADHARGGYRNLASRVGSGQEVFEISPDGAGRGMSEGFQISWVGTDFTLTKPDP